MQDDIDSAAGFAANVGVHDAAFDEAMALPGLGAHRMLDLTEVFPIAGGEVIQADHLMPEDHRKLRRRGPAFDLV